MPAPIKISVPPSSNSTRQETTASLSSSLPSTASASAPTLISPRPTHARKPSSIACPACTFLNHPSMRSCEICGTDLPRIQAVAPEMKSAPASRPTSPESDSDEDESGSTRTRIMKLSFRKGGDKAFYAVLKRSLQGKAWEIKNLGVTPSREPEFNRSGISGIIRTVEASAQGRDTDMSHAFQDLEALMVKAKDMVKLAEDLNERLTASSTLTSTSSVTSETSPSSSVTTLISTSPTEPEEVTFIRSSLSQLGLQMANAPVTLDMMKDEKKWFEELAKELAGVLQGQGRSTSTSQATTQGGMMKQRGVIALDEVWGGWNRARGVALIPPSTFLQVLPLLPVYTSPPINKRQFNSGLAVLHTPPYSSAAFAARLCGLLTLVGPKTTTEIAEEEGMTVGLASEMMGSVEETGDVCRDDGSAAIREGREEAGEIEKVVGEGQSLGGMIVAGEVRWWANLFLGYNWDGQVDA
ncbi:Vacuolar protein-sorting-associated protein 36, variant 2 [Stygiomarasmius scandens]